MTLNYRNEYKEKKGYDVFYELCQNTRDSSTRRVSVVRGSVHKNDDSLIEKYTQGFFKIFNFLLKKEDIWQQQ